MSDQVSTRQTHSSWLKEWKRRQGREVSESDDHSGPGRIIAELSAKAMVSNYRAIQDQVPHQSILPMIKADGYGHGATWVARQLLASSGLYGFGVATLEEAAQLRKELGPAGRTVRILVFSGACGWTDEKGELCERLRLTPVIATDRDWNAFVRNRWHERIPYELKFNTGMNRLGLSLSLVGNIVKTLRGKESETHPEGILTHLASAEQPDAPLSRQQRDRFRWLREELSGVFPKAHFHLGNSAAIWNQKYWDLKNLSDVVRPGLALYGVIPWQDAPERGISPVMTLKANVVMVQRLKPGEAMGYGGHFKVTGTRPAHVAVISAGYADGLSRTLSGHLPGGGGHVWLGGKAQRFLGVVSMDLSAVSASPETEAGEWAEILGPNVDHWAQAKAGQTIPYELLTSVSYRVQRIYG